jgi:hypothetical protein
MEETPLNAGKTQKRVGSMGEVHAKMEGKTLKCWEEFEEAALRAISETRGLKERREGYVDYPLFRGVGDSRHPLRSSLERLGKATTLSEYHHTVDVVHKYVETVTGKKWDLDTRVHLGEFDLRAYEFMAYLRQNGFPSPLLDWTKSPYIAAFFAFRDVYHEPADREYASIFVFRKYCGNGKDWISQKPHIHTLGPSIATCQTHYLQQSEYSICVREESGEIYFARYEDVRNDNADEQDVLVKYDIPISERDRVLKRLDQMNITAYSLFHSEPSLMDTLAIRELVLEI